MSTDLAAAQIDRIVLTPNPDGRGVSIEVQGRLAGIVALATGRELPDSLTAKVERVKGTRQKRKWLVTEA